MPIFEKFIKKGVMDKATSVAKLAKIDVSEKENLLPAKNVDIGFATRKVVNNLQAKKKASDRQILGVSESVSYISADIEQ